MAVEATHLNLFPQQDFITNRDLVNFNHANAYGYNTQMGPFPTTMAETLLPFNNQSLVCDSIQGKTSMKADSGLTYNLPAAAAAPRKRSRDSMNQLNSTVVAPQKNNILPDFSSFLGEDINISLQIQQHQLEMDHIISQHTKKIRMEVEERQKQQARLMVSALGESVARKLKEKDEQIQRIGKLNMVLQEKLKSLFVENQLWRDLARTNEATAMSLRCNLEQVLAHVTDERLLAPPVAAEEVESCCGSNDYGREGEGEEVVVVRQRAVAAEEVGGGKRMCKKCGERESCVLLLPCRHLCLCKVCGTTLPSTCPVCNSGMNATVHVNTS